MDTREGSGNGSRSDSEFSEEFLLLRGLFEEVLDRPLSDLDGHARLVEDIGADSLAMAEVCAALEERGLLVTDDAWAPEQTLGGLLAAVTR
jgi:acyl carrier protein